ncbi:MAG: ion transporter [Prevotella sp.]|nr:ion transporter [Prevotella sp.]
MKKNLNKRYVIDLFINTLLALNLLAAFMLTDPDIQSAYGKQLNLFVDISIVCFIVEIGVRMWWAKKDGSMWSFFRKDHQWRHWNCFDFTVTLLAAASLLSGLGAFVGARTLRMLRLLNAMRLFSRHKRMQNVSEAIIKAMPSIVGTGIYFTMLYSIYAIAGVNLFSQIDPYHFGNLGRAFMFLFQLMTLDDWSEVMYPLVDHDPWAWFYFFSFILIASYVLLNLIVGIIIDSLQQVRRRRELEQRSSKINVEIEQMKQQLREFQIALENWEQKAYNNQGNQNSQSNQKAQNSHSHKSRKTSKARKSGKSGK